MKTFKEAAEIATNLYNRFNYCEEYEKCYVFSEYDNEVIGGDGEPAVVIKETGECIIFISALDDGLLHGDPIKEDYIKNW